MSCQSLTYFRPRNCGCQTECQVRRPGLGGPMLTDVREALRHLRNAPGITTTAVMTLALGIGATTAIFTLVHQVMLKSLPVTRPDELWRIGDKVRCCNWGGYTQGDDGDFSLFSPRLILETRSALLRP